MNGPSKIDMLIEEVREIKAEQKTQGERIYEIHGSVSKLEVKSGIFGLFGGLIVAFLTWWKGHIG